MIEKCEIAAVKALDLPAVLDALGIKSTIGRQRIPMVNCPFHDDRTPSCGVYSDHYHCFACGAHGDVLDIVQQGFGVGLKEALVMIQGVGGLPTSEDREVATRLSYSGTLRDAVMEHTKSIREKGFSLTALHCYRHPSGEPAFWKMRLQRGVEKYIRPIMKGGEGWVIGEPPAPKPLYNANLIAKHDVLVWFVEGEKCADLLVRHKKLATTTGSATSAGQFDFSPLAARRVIIWPDADKPGLAYAKTVAHKLLTIGAQVKVLHPAQLRLGPGEDAADYLSSTYPQNQMSTPLIAAQTIHDATELDRFIL